MVRCQARRVFAYMGAFGQDMESIVCCVNPTNFCSVLCVAGLSAVQVHGAAVALATAVQCFTSAVMTVVLGAGQICMPQQATLLVLQALHDAWCQVGRH